MTASFLLISAVITRIMIDVILFRRIGDLVGQRRVHMLLISYAVMKSFSWKKWTTAVEGIVLIISFNEIGVAVFISSIKHTVQLVLLATWAVYIIEIKQ